MWVYLAFVLIGSAVAQVPEFGACPNLQVKQDFDATKFVGTWFEAQRYFNVFEIGGKCTTATYTSHQNGTIGVLNKQLSTITGETVTIEGLATQDVNEKAKFTVTFPSLPYPVEAPYWVIDTDYESFAVVYSCRSIGAFSVKFAWLLTREQLPAKSSLGKAFAVFDKNHIDRSKLEVIDQQNCS